MKSGGRAPAARPLPWRLGLGALALCVSLAAPAYTGPTALRAKFDQLREQLHHNGFHRALHIDSTEAGDTLRGDVYAVLDYPFATVTGALKDPREWCDILILPFNTKYCKAVGNEQGARLLVGIGRRPDQPVQDAYKLEFGWRPVVAGADYFETRISAPSGPVGTRDYHITVSAVPLDGKRTFLHLSYSYGYGLSGRLAMQAYLATAGADKVGFTTSGRDGDGQPVYIGGMRGAIERTAMRYYLAIDAHLVSLAAPPDQQREKRIEAWFDATERYPRQLHEMDRARYIAMKRDDYERQSAKID